MQILQTIHNLTFNPIGTWHAASTLTQIVSVCVAAILLVAIVAIIVQGMTLRR